MVEFTIEPWMIALTGFTCYFVIGVTLGRVFWAINEEAAAVLCIVLWPPVVLVLFVFVMADICKFCLSVGNKKRREYDDD